MRWPVREALANNVCRPTSRVLPPPSTTRTAVREQYAANTMAIPRHSGLESPVKEPPTADGVGNLLSSGSDDVREHFGNSKLWFDGTDEVHYLQILASRARSQTATLSTFLTGHEKYLCQPGHIRVDGLHQRMVIVYFYSVTLCHTFHLCFRCRYPSTFSPVHLARSLLSCPRLSYIVRTVCTHFSCRSSKYTSFPHAPYRKRSHQQVVESLVSLVIDPLPRQGLITDCNPLFVSWW